MPSERRVLRIFIGSPRDLQEERKKAKEVVDRINNVINVINWSVDLRGWEDTLPGYSRPQERINPAVEDCDLFLGLLWGRWGSPTGKYTSGFEEEFEIARERRKNTGEPEIWLYFKRIPKIDPEELLQDHDEQLKKVLEFKREVQEHRDLFYKEFADVDEWEELFHDNLMKYLVKYILDFNEREREPAGTPEPVASPPISSAQTAGPSPIVAIDQLPQEVSTAIQILLSALNDPEQFHTMDDYYRGRFFLMASSFLYVSNHLFETIGTHEIQFLYSHREKMELWVKLNKGTKTAIGFCPPSKSHL